MNKEFSLDLLKVGNLVEFNTGEIMRVVRVNNNKYLLNYKGQLQKIEKSSDETNYIIIGELGESFLRFGYTFSKQLRIKRIFLPDKDEDFDDTQMLRDNRLILWEEKSIEDEEDYLAKWKRLSYNTKIKAINKVDKNIITGEFWGVDERTVANKKEDGILLKIINNGEVSIRNLHFNWHDFEVIE